MNHWTKDPISNRGPIPTIALVLALIITASGCNLSLPVSQIKTGPTQTVDLQVPMPDGSSTNVELYLEFVGGDLKLSPGAGDYLASGVATFNVSEFKPQLEASGSSYTLRTGNQEIEGIPITKDDIINEWDLQLANTPMSLNINAGAYNGSFELGGLSLEKLAISDGGADVTGAFSAPNNVEMSFFTYATGASSAKLEGLANANFEQMTFTSGAGDYTLSFDGVLQRDAKVTIDSGLGSITIIVPEGVNAQVTIDGLSTVKTDSGWAQKDKVYTLSGDGPTLTITIKMGAGTLNLETK